MSGQDAAGAMQGRNGVAAWRLHVPAIAGIEFLSRGGAWWKLLGPARGDDRTGSMDVAAETLGGGRWLPVREFPAHVGARVVRAIIDATTQSNEFRANKHAALSAARSEAR